jgi:hypothetical protein
VFVCALKNARKLLRFVIAPSPQKGTASRSASLVNALCFRFVAYHLFAVENHLHDGMLAKT